MPNNFFLENVTVCETMWKIFRVGQATGDTIYEAEKMCCVCT